MVAVVAVETGKATKGKSAAEDGETTPPPAAVPKRPKPTPDHPPYSWMIGQAIAALSEDGGSAEAAISGFIRARYPGVPAAHDRLLRHYLAKHVAEGLFVCIAPGRYSRRPDEPALAEIPAMKPPAARSPETKSVGSPATEAKRGRGRGRRRKDGSSPTSPAGKKGGSESPSSKPKRRGRPRKLALVTAADGSGDALVTDKKDGSEAPSTTSKNHGQPRGLALMIANDGSTTTSVTEDGGETPPVKLALVAMDDSTAPTSITANKDGNARSTTPENNTHPCKLALMAADDGCALVLVAEKKDGRQAPSAKHKRRRQPCKSAPVNAALGSAPTSIADKTVSGKAPSTSPKAKGRRGQRKPAVATIDDGSVPTSVAGKKDGSEVPSASPKLAPVTADGGSAQTSVAGKKGANEAPSVPVKPYVPPRKLYPLTADELRDNPTSCVLALPARMPATTKV